jgi:cytochrome P450
MEDYVLLVRSWRRLIPRWVPQPVVGRIRRASRQIDTIIEAIVAQKRAGALQGDDLLTRLLLARDEAAPGADRGMDDRQLRDELVTLFTAGHETTALTLGYSLHALADRPDLQEAIRGEAESLAPGRALTAGDVARMPLTTAVIRESMRMYPPAWIIGREALRDCNIGPYRVRRKEQVLIAPYTLHRDSRWFDAPDEFRPERWADGLYERLPKYAYLPFGGGPRICIGNHFAMMEAVLVLATVLRGALFAPASAAATLRFFPSVTLRPAGGLPLSVTRS